MSKIPNRREVLAGLASGTAVLLASGELVLAQGHQTPVARLWARAESLKAELGPHKDAILSAERARKGGATGWMYLDGEAYNLSNQRYDALVELLNQKPKNSRDLALMERAARDHEMLNGPKRWALAQVAAASMALAA